MWTELEVYGAVDEAADVLGVSYAGVTVSQVGDDMSVLFCDETNSPLGEYLVTKGGTVTPIEESN